MRLLLIAGHGEDDPGTAAQVNGRQYREVEETRRVVLALQKALGAGAAVYPTGRNAFEDYKRGVLKEKARFQRFDFVLEIHFNAFVPSTADGRVKGVEAYVPTAAEDLETARRLCRAVESCGFSNRGVKQKDWSVICAAGKAGAAACLLEICFLDDGDDMALYERRFSGIIRALSRALGEVEDVTVYEKLEDVPAWGRPTVEKLLKKGWLRGEGETLALEHNLLRGLVVNDRAGLYGA